MYVKKTTDIQREAVPKAEKTFKQVLIGPEMGPHFAMRLFTIEPGGYMPRHTNTVEHEQYVVHGSAHIAIGDEEYTVRQGDVVFIPEGIPHWYKNTGAEPFRFLCMVPNRRDEIKILE